MIVVGIAINEEQEKEMIDINLQLNALAQGGEANASYTYGKELFSVVRNNKLSDREAER